MTYEDNDSEQEPKKINVFAHDNEETSDEDSSEEQSAQNEHDDSSDQNEHDTPAEEQDNPLENDSPSEEQDAPAKSDHEDSPKEPDLPDLSDETSEIKEVSAAPSEGDSVDSVIEHKSFEEKASNLVDSITAPSPYSARPPEGTAKPIPSSVHNTDAPKTDNKPKEAPKAAAFKPTVVTMQKKFNPQYIVYGVLLVLILGLGYWAYSLKSDNADLKKQLTSSNSQLAQANANPQALVQKQTDALIAKVGQLTTLPAGETPSVYTVSDPVAAQKQSAFFANAQVGDKTLVYAKAAQAILYRPSTNKVILVAPLTYSNTATTAKPAATTPATTTKH